jgi:cytochrome c oxidase subunit II
VLTYRCVVFAALGGLIVLTAGCGGSGGSTPTAGSSARGKALYTSLTCDGCHTLTGIRATGPTFRRLAGSQVKLKSGKTVTADDDYLFESIETPNKEIVASFSALMEAVIKPHSVSEQDARDLIAFIKTVR